MYLSKLLKRARKTIRRYEKDIWPMFNTRNSEIILSFTLKTGLNWCLVAIRFSLTLSRLRPIEWNKSNSSLNQPAQNCVRVGFFVAREFYSWFCLQIQKRNYRWLVYRTIFSNFRSNLLPIINSGLSVPMHFQK